MWFGGFVKSCSRGLQKSAVFIARGFKKFASLFVQKKKLHAEATLHLSTPQSVIPQDTRAAHTKFSAAPYAHKRSHPDSRPALPVKPAQFIKPALHLAHPQQHMLSTPSTPSTPTAAAAHFTDDLVDDADDISIDEGLDIYSKRANRLIRALKPAEASRKTYAQCCNDDDRNAKLVMARLSHYKRRLLPITAELEDFCRKRFKIEFVRNYTHGAATDGGIIEIDPPILNASREVIAFTLVHETGHHDLEHLRNRYNKERIAITEEEGEHSADFYAGLFLGYHHYNYSLEKLLKAQLEMPDGGTAHGTREERAKIIAKGYFLGVEMERGELEVGFVPAYRAYRQRTGRSPWDDKQDTAYTEDVLNLLLNTSRHPTLKPLKPQGPK